MNIESSNLVDTNILKNKYDDLENKDLKEVCNDFESFFMQQLMDISLRSTNVAGEGTGSDIIKSMYIESVSSNTNGNIGISDMLYGFLTENNKEKK